MDDVRTAAMMAMPELLDSCIIALNKGTAGATADLVSQLLNFMLEPIFDQLKAEPDVETLSCQLEAFGELIAHGTKCDAAKFAPQQMHTCTEVIQMLMKESIERQGEREKRRGGEDVDDDEEEELEGEAEREEIVMQSLVEVAGKMFEVYKSAFLPYFDGMLMPIISAMLQPTAIPANRSAALCVFDDVIEHCSADGASTRYLEGVFPAFLQYAADQSTDVRQAAVYGIGIMAEKCNDSAFTAAMMQQAAQAIVMVVEAPTAWDDSSASATDNAVSALGKLCKRSPEIAAVGWVRWLQTLPLKTDKEEARNVHTMLVEQVEASNSKLLGVNHERLPEVIIIFGQLLGTDLVSCSPHLAACSRTNWPYANPRWRGFPIPTLTFCRRTQIDEGLRARISHLLKQVHSGLPAVLQQLPTHPKFSLLTEDNRRELEKAISS
eukprot:scaffold259758_cov33-Tisochrysis_lutea.AAC.3